MCYFVFSGLFNLIRRNKTPQLLALLLFGVDFDLISFNIYIDFHVMASKMAVGGTVHPKMKILSSFSDSSVVTSLYRFLCSDERKARYFEELIRGPIDFHCIIFSYYGGECSS